MTLLAALGSSLMRVFSVGDETTIENLCPKCSREIPDDSIWTNMGQIYCCEGCARSAGAN